MSETLNPNRNHDQPGIGLQSLATREIPISKLFDMTVWLVVAFECGRFLGKLLLVLGSRGQDSLGRSAPLLWRTLVGLRRGGRHFVDPFLASSTDPLLLVFGLFFLFVSLRLDLGDWCLFSFGFAVVHLLCDAFTRFRFFQLVEVAGFDNGGWFCLVLAPAGLR